MEEGVLDKLSDQDLLTLANRLGIVTNETQIDRRTLLRDLQQQVLKT
jgi:hypothetical protein